MNSNEKRCGKCRKNYRKAAGSVVSFDGHEGKDDGLQPFCRACDWDAKHQPRRGWKRLRADGRGIIIGITEFEYRSLIESNQCHWCKGELFRWGGYWVDRLDSSAHYERGNVIPCCRWCNHYKNDLPPAAWAVMISSLIQRYGAGDGAVRFLNWESLGAKYASTRPDLSRLEVRDDAQPGLFAALSR